MGPLLAQFAEQHRHRTVGRLRPQPADASSRLLGGQLRESVPAYAATGYVTTTPDLGEFRVQIERALAEGFTAVKIKIGTGPDENAQRVAVTRELLAPDGRLLGTAMPTRPSTRSCGP
ncbi:hypothetical protein [Streptomyces viridochromogenes]|uniref:hypothetical protein n=1 Tax=Streptomyces viridochromogenes TaxID=1938 RepID=UPI0013315E71|nr:hypothetical protein [Streptomyces viridochromogenes]